MDVAHFLYVFLKKWNKQMLTRCEKVVSILQLSQAEGIQRTPTEEKPCVWNIFFQHQPTFLDSSSPMAKQRTVPSWPAIARGVIETILALGRIAWRAMNMVTFSWILYLMLGSLFVLLICFLFALWDRLCTNRESLAECIQHVWYM